MDNPRISPVYPEMFLGYSNIPPGISLELQDPIYVLDNLWISPIYPEMFLRYSNISLEISSKIGISHLCARDNSPREEIWITPAYLGMICNIQMCHKVYFQSHNISVVS